MSAPSRIGYVVKRYPRYSETFIVTEILAHEAAGVAVEIFALLPPADTHFQDILALVKAPVHYLVPEVPKASELWSGICKTAATYPNVWNELRIAATEVARDLHQALLLSQKVATRGLTHLHAHFASSPTTVAMLASRFTGIPYTFTAHAKDIFHESVDPQDMERKLRSAAGIVTVSDYNRRYLQQTYGSAAARVERIYNGLDLPRLRFASPAERPPRIVAVGRLVEKKGFADLIAACAILKERGRRFECDIVGDGELAGDLHALVNSLHLTEQVRLVGSRPQAEAFGIIQGSAVFAAPCIVGNDSNRDGLPTVLVEAMALGTPCISTDVTGIPEVIREGQTGLVVAQHDPGALAAALERLLSDGGLRVRLASAARRLVDAQFDTHRNTADLRRIFADAAGHALTEGGR
ncbi:MAG TPA: glycosyltransferase family 4 protein [Tepidisphaeraceae bacterium]|jgi:glycosyltransferase involved in cell wall biosynthesis|nr:glycosyltransferase family 4 protein [Tepidisphaeraceae bacterium]